MPRTPLPRNCRCALAVCRGTNSVFQHGDQHVYAGHRLKGAVVLVQGAWDAFAPDPLIGGFSSWLPTWYEEVVSSTEAESHWVATTLPDQHPALVLHLLTGLFAKVDKAFRIRLSAAIQGACFLAPCGVCAACQQALLFPNQSLQACVLNYDVSVPVGNTVGPAVLPALSACDKPRHNQLDNTELLLARAGLGDGATALGVLIHLQHAAQRFVRGLQRALSVVAPEQLVDLATAVFAPCEAQVAR